MVEAGSLIRSLSGKTAARNFHSFVINEIGAGIVSGKYPVGSVLANDATMMETYGVSRTVLREAIKTLEAKGMVEARPKVGTRVTPPGRWNFFDPQVLFWHFDAKADERFYHSLFDMRSDMARRAATLASRHRTAEQVRVMKYWVHQIDIADGLALAAQAALEVQTAIASSSGNPLLQSGLAVVEFTLALAAQAQIAGRIEPAAASQAGLYGELVAALETSAGNDAVDCLEAIAERDRQTVFNNTAWLAQRKLAD